MTQQYTHAVNAPNAAPGASNGGCTGAVRTTIARMIAAGTYNTPRAAFAQHNGLDTAQNVLVGASGAAGVCGDVRATVPGCAAMPFADCISFAGLLAVAAKRATPPGGCPWSPGRVDAGGNNNAALLPSEFGNAAAQRQVFARYGMPVERFGLTLDRAITLLLGAHTIGRSRVTRESRCSKGLARLSATPDTFDTEYYQSLVINANVINNTAASWFCADMGLVCNDVTYEAPRPRAPPPTLRRGYCAGRTDSPLYPIAAELAAGGNAAFFSGFCSAVSDAGGPPPFFVCLRVCYWARARGASVAWKSRITNALTLTLTNTDAPTLTLTSTNASTLTLITNTHKRAQTNNTHTHTKQYQAMSLIGFEAPASYAADAARFAPLLAPFGA